VHILVVGLATHLTVGLNYFDRKQSAFTPHVSKEITPPTQRKDIWTRFEWIRVLATQRLAPETDVAGGLLRVVDLAQKGKM